MLLNQLFATDFFSLFQTWFQNRRHEIKRKQRYQEMNDALANYRNKDQSDQ